MTMRIVALGLAGAALTACASGGAKVVQAISPEMARGAFVREVALTSGAPPSASKDFETVFEKTVKQRIGQCAMGTATPLRLEAEITDFKRANPAMTWLVADTNQIRGTARLVNPADNSVVGSYDIKRSFGGAGLVGIALMAEAEEQMSGAFAEELCKQAFPKK